MNKTNVTPTPRASMPATGFKVEATLGDYL